MSSNRQLLADGAAKRADLVKVRLDQIHAEPGFNAPESPEDFEARVEAMSLHLAEGGRLPPIEVRDRADGGVFIVDGHARHAAYARAAGRGVPLEDPKDGAVYILTIPFVGNDADRIVRLATSAEGRTLSPLQSADIYKRLVAFDWTPAQIAKKVGRSEVHVRSLLDLGNANTDVQKMVAAKEVSAAVAAKTARKHGDNAGAVLAGHLEQAKATGRSKVTASVVRGISDKQMLDWLEERGGKYPLSFLRGNHGLRDAIREEMKVEQA